MQAGVDIQIRIQGQRSVTVVFKPAVLGASGHSGSTGSSDVFATAADRAVRQADEAWARAAAGMSVEQTTTIYDAEAFTAGAAMPPVPPEIEVRCLQTPDL
jgi:hypothetical protein